MDSTYSLTLGDLERSGFRELVDRLQNRYQYRIERNDAYGNGEIRLRTYWKKHLPFTDDPAFKPTEVETRVTLRTRSKNRQGYRLFTVSFKGEYRALVTTESGDKVFKRIEMTEAAEDYFVDLATDLKDRIRGSIRGY